MGDSDSDDSEGEGGLGNVSRVIIRPPGQSGKAKRGHLCFDAAFETGNLGKADLIGDYEYDLFLRPDTCNPRFRFWFNFTVDNVKQDQRVIFNIVNISKPHNLYSSCLTPLVKSSSRPKWQRLPKKNVFYYRSALHQNHYVLSFAFTFDKEEDVYQFAVTPPYSYSRLQSYLNVMDARQPSGEKRYERSVLTKTLQGRHLDLLTVDHVSGKSVVNRVDRSLMRVIVILCRSYGAEAPASFACQGFIEFLASSHPMALALRENFIFKIVPMVNPDGVFLGNNRCNLIGQDMNRTWHVATEFSHPTLYAIKSMLKQLDSSDSYQIDFVIDLHANSSLHGCFIYGNTYEDVYRHERHLVFPRLFAANARDYVSEHMMFNADERKGGSARRFFCERLSDTVNTYSVEISMGGHYLKDGKTVTLYTEDGYYRCGRNLARTFLQYYRFTNVLPLPVVKEIRSKRRNRARQHSRSRSKSRYEVKPRPKAERCHAPISYTNISICYDSGGGGVVGGGGGGVSSDEGGFSPTRPTAPGSSHFSGYRNYRRPLTGGSALTHEQFSLMSIKSSKFDQLNFSNDPTAAARTNRLRTAHGDKEKSAKVGSSLAGGYEASAVSFNVPPKPYLSIIDLNQLTRGTLNRNVRSLDGGHDH